jgi:fibronectin-binding autotransporter adhesin
MSGGNISIASGLLNLSSTSSFTGGNISITAAGGRINTASSGPTTVGNVTFSYSNASNASQGLVLSSGLFVNASTTASFTNVSSGVGQIKLNGATRTIDVDTGATMNVGWIISVSGAGDGLTKNGTGTLNLSAANTYTGATTINAGTLTLSSGSAIADTGAVVMANATSTVLNVNASETIGNLSGGGTLGGNIAIAASQTLTVNQTSALTYAGAISGAGGLTKNGTSTLTLNGTNTYSGTTTINTGILQIGSGGTTGALSTSSAITNNSGLVFNRSNDTTQGTHFSNNIGGSGTLTQNGSGTLFLNTGNSYTGATTINTGIIRASNATALGTTAGGVTVASGAVLELIGGITIGAEALSLSGTGISTGGALRNISGDNSYAGAITLAAASRINSDAGLLTLSGAIGGAFALTVGGAGNTTISNAIGTSTGTLTKDGDGTLTLAGNNAYTGLTTISLGTLTLSGNNNAATGGVTLTAGTLNINNANALGTGALTLSANTTINNTSGAAISNLGNQSVTLNDGLTFGNANSTSSNNLNLGSGSVTVSDSLVITLAGTNTTLTMGSANITSTSSGRTLTANGTGNTLVLGGLSLSQRTNVATVSLAGTANIRIEGAIVPGTAFAHRLTITNTGTTTLSGNNTYGGLTTMNAAGGTLTLAGNNSGAAGGVTLTAGTLNINNANALGTGALTLSANTTINNTSGAAITNLGNQSWALNDGLTFGNANSTSSNNLNLGSGSVTVSDSLAITLAGTNTTLTMGSANITSTSSGRTLTANGIGNTLVLGGLSLSQRTNVATVSLAGTANIRIEGAIVPGTPFAHGLTITNTGTTTLSGNNTYEGATTISAGTLEIGAAGRLGGGSYAGAITNNAAFIFSGTNAQTLSGIISGSGALTQNASSTLTLTGANTYTGTTTISAGTIQIGAAGRLGAGSYAGDISNNATLIYSGTNAQTLSGIISGTGALTQNNSGSTLTLTGANTYTGTTTINAGTLQLGNNGATGSLSTDSAITVNGALVFRRSDAITQGTQFSGAAITGTGVVIQNSANSTTLNNSTNSFSGGVWVQQGTVYAAGIGNASASGYLGSCGTIQLGSSSNTGTLRLTGSTSETTDKVIDLAGTTGGGMLTVDSSAAIYTFSNSFTASGVGAKTLTLQGSGTSSGGFVLNGAIVDSSSGATSLSVGGNGSLTVTLGCATNSFSGPVSIVGNTSGKTYTLQVAGIGNTGAASYLGTNSTISLGTSSSGTNILKYTGPGETTDKVINLASTNNNNQASLDASNASGLLKFTSDFTATGTASSKVLNLIGTGTAEIAGAIVNNTSGNVTNVTKSGAGTWTLSGNNTYTGTTTISGGTLVISGTNTGSAITVSSGGTLAGTGTGGSTTVNSGGTIAPGNSPGILTVGGLTLNGNGTYTWEMADATGAAGTGWDQINATGLLTIGSNATSTFKIAITSSGAPTNWDYTTTNQTWDIIDYGSISGFNASHFSLNSTAFGGDLSVDSSWSLVDTGSALRLTYTYTQNTPTYTGASGNWSTGFSPSLDNTENAVFVGVGGTATNDIASGTLSSIGTLTFGGSNSYTLEAASGSAGYNSAAALAIGGTIVNNSAAVQTINLATSFAANQTINANTGGLVIGGNVSIGTGAILTVVGSNNTTISGVVSGLGGLTKNSSSTLTLSGNNSYSDGTTITAGTLLVGHDKALGTGTLRFGGTIASTDGTDRTISNSVAGLSGTWTYTFGQASGGTGNLTFTDASNANFASTGVKTFNVLNTTSFANAFISTGNVTVTKIGAGTLILAGNSTYSGSTVINAGTLQIGNGGTSGVLSASSTITNNGTLVFNRSNTVAQGTNFSTAAITGTGSIIQNGSGTLVLNAANTYSGGTTLNTGTLVIGNAAAAGTGTITQTDGTSLLKIDTTGTLANTMSLYNVAALQSATLSGTITVNNATFDVESGDTLTLSGGVGGSGGVTKNGTGSLVLSGSNTYSGATTVNAGTLNAAHANALGTNAAVTVNGGSLLVSADDAINSKNLILNSSATGLIFSGTYNGTAGTLTLNQNSILDLGTGSVVIRFSDIVWGGSTTLDIYNWTGTTLWGGGDGNNTDQFYIDSSLDAGELNRISFHSGGLGTSSFVGTGYQLSGGSFNNEVIPVPEPETYATAVLLLIGLGFFVRHNRRKRRFY